MISMETTRDWGGTPREILGIILTKLTINTLFSFKYVCQHWYFSFQQDANLGLLHPVPSPPWLASADTPEKTPNPSTSFFSPSNDTVYEFDKMYVSSWHAPEEATCIGSSHGLLAFEDKNFVVSLVNPFKPEQSAIILPSVKTLYSDSVLDHQWGRKFYDLRMLRVSKLVLCPTVSCPGKYTVMIIYSSRKELAFCKSDDDSWTAMPLFQERNYQDMYYSRDSYFYAIGAEGLFVIWDLRNTNSPKLIHAYHFNFPWIRSSSKLVLAKLGGDFFLAVSQRVKYDPSIHNEQSSDKRFGVFNVYKLDCVEKVLEKVESLGDNGDGVFFLGINNAVSFSAREFPGLKSNSIYLVVDEEDTGYGFDLGIFSLEDNSIRPYLLYDPCDLSKIPRPPVWISPKPW